MAGYAGGFTGYVDIEQVLGVWLTAQTGARSVTELPANLQDVLPVNEIHRIGGSEHTRTIDVALVDVTTYAASYGDAASLALQVRGLLRMNLPGTTVAGGVVLRVDSNVPPVWQTYADPMLRRFGATYAITVQSQ